MYLGGSNPGGMRWIRPQRFFSHAYGNYIEAFCENRGEVRYFNFAKLKVIREEILVPPKHLSDKNENRKVRWRALLAFAVTILFLIILWTSCRYLQPCAGNLF